MDLKIFKGEITKDGKIMIIFSGGPNTPAQLWYPSEEEVDILREAFMRLDDIHKLLEFDSGKQRP